MNPEQNNQQAHETREAQEASRRAAVNGLAVVGFIVLIIFGIILAIYSAHYLPLAVSKITTSSSTPASLSIVPGTTTSPFSDSGSSATTTGLVPITPITVSPINQTQPSANSGTQHAPTKPSQPALYGLPNLTTSVLVTGYLANGTNASFIPAQVIPAGARAAIQFTITNTGTNATGPWNFIAKLPESNGYTFSSPVEENLNPGDHILFTLGFDQVHIAPGPQVVTVIADPNNLIPETNEADNVSTMAFQVAE